MVNEMTAVNDFLVKSPLSFFEEKHNISNVTMYTYLSKDDSKNPPNTKGNPKTNHNQDM